MAENLLWLADRSRYEKGLGFCLRARFLEYHWNGYGLSRKAESVPLATGTYVHQALAAILRTVQASDALPSEQIVAGACQEAVSAYQQVVVQRGFTGLAADERLEEVASEQSCLVEGLVRAWVMGVLPEVLATRRILLVEDELIYPLTCTCGLGAGRLAIDQHLARGCQGIGWMTRPDFVAQYRARPDVLTYEEFKTEGGWAKPAEEWETKIQFASSLWAVEAKFEREVGELWVHVLSKGRRQGEYDQATKQYSGAPYQNSPLCYGYRKEPSAPGQAAEWAPRYTWVDEFGQSRRLGKGWQRTGIWQLGRDYDLSGFTPSAFWLRMLDDQTVRDSLKVLGPLARQGVLLEELREEVAAHEEQWRQEVGEYFTLLDAAQEDWTAPEVQTYLQRTWPRSWDCRRYGLRHQCAFVPICFKHEGWQDPLGTGHFVQRRPHHEPELSQAIECGCVPAEVGAADEGEE